MAGRKPAAKKAARELIAKNYRLLKYEPLTFTLKVGRDKTLLVFDEETQRNRAIRHCPNEPSIFVDEQSESAVVEPIVFRKGLLETKPHDTITQDFLEVHPRRGFTFELIDEGADALEMVDLEEARIDVKTAIRNKAKEESGIDELRLIASVLMSDVVATSKMSVAEIKNNLYDLVDSNIFRFIDESGKITIFDDMEIQRAAIAQHSFNSGKIQVSADGSKVMWSDNKATICHIPVGQDHLEFFAKFLGTEDGIKVAGEISKR